ncbi:MAG: 2Fe-2S iron-sulfur cluster binding domain-containing protein, partial [Variovorax sp.]|nr:2Fe-2S iron-sulfur cluster binding domain-containing protein [Variovorax sp.]
LNPDHSCKEGVCGACETAVIEGEVDHHDGILTKIERASNKTMMICVSRCKGERLVLDI